MVSKLKPPEVPAAPLNDILVPLARALQEKCGLRDLAMSNAGDTSSSRTIYALRGTGAVVAYTDRRCIVNRLFPKSNPELWIGVSVEVKRRTRSAPAAKDTYELFHVGIQVFEGATSETIQPLLRAEWDQIGARSKQGPAQPHWHAYATSRLPHSIVYSGFHEPAVQPVSAMNPKRRQHPVHFALCANWQSGGSHFETLNSPAQLESWILGALEYIRSERT